MTFNRADVAAKLGKLGELIDEVNTALDNAGPGVLVPLNSTWSAECARDAAEYLSSTIRHGETS